VIDLRGPVVWQAVWVGGVSAWVSCAGAWVLWVLWVGCVVVARMRGRRDGNLSGTAFDADECTRLGLVRVHVLVFRLRRLRVWCLFRA
jgi:hypothetical protein